jgi:hypothetical protein
MGDTGERTPLTVYHVWPGGLLNVAIGIMPVKSLLVSRQVPIAYAPRRYNFFKVGLDKAICDRYGPEYHLKEILSTVSLLISIYNPMYFFDADSKLIRPAKSQLNPWRGPWLG